MEGYGRIWKGMELNGNNGILNVLRTGYFFSEQIILSRINSKNYIRLSEISENFPVVNQFALFLFIFKFSKQTLDIRMTQNKSLRDFKFERL